MSLAENSKLNRKFRVMVLCRMGTEREQQFCLRWHNYQNCLLATLPQLLDGDDLTDVTLCAGGRNIRAHKVVLSACSQYFKDLFKVGLGLFVF